MTGASASLLGDFSPGDASSAFGNFASSNGLLLFDVNESEIWRTDGTARGTVKLADEDLSNSFVLESGNLTFFEVQSVGGVSIWRTDGTPDGTFEILRGRSLQATIDSRGLVIREPEVMTASGLHFFTSLVEGRRELYRTDGTAENTRMVSPLISDYTVTSRALFYLEAQEDVPTQPISRLPHDAVSSEPLEIGIDYQRIQNLQTVSDKLLFFVNEDLRWTTPWVSDGSDEGTFSLSNQRFDRRIQGAMVNDVYVYIDTFHIFRTDGTIDGTFRLAEAGWTHSTGYLGMGENWAYFISSESNRFRITATDGTRVTETISRSFTRSELIDGQLILNSQPCPFPHSFSVFDEQLGDTYFHSPTSVDYQAARVGDFWYYTSEEYEPRTSPPETFHNRILLGDDESVTRMETFGGIMLTDNTSTLVAGTRTTKNPRDPLFTFGDGQLSALDGGLTPRPITQLEVVGPMHYGDDGLYFVNDTAGAGREVWRSDGTTDGTAVIDLFPGANSSDPELIHWEGMSLVIANTPGIGRELFRIGVPPAGDTNGDFAVDFSDFLVLSQNFAEQVDGPSMGDFNEDGFVSFADFLILAHEFKSTA